MRIMITGAKGMLGRTLAKRLTDQHVLHPVDIDDFDLSDINACMKNVGAFRPDVVLHAAAMTAVDRCEVEKEAAFRCNAAASANIAIACQRFGARIIAFSTDYVFPGNLDRPYTEWDPTGPTNVYGSSKLAGEQAVIAHCPDHLICRLAWLYGQGGPSFLHTMLKLGRAEGKAVMVVNDQVGNPTTTDAVADHVALLLDHSIAGVIHLTCEGEATWYDFAKEIFALGELKREIVPCRSSEFPRPAIRPANSRLEKLALRLYGLPPMPDWRAALSRFYAQYPSDWESR